MNDVVDLSVTSRKVRLTFGTKSDATINARMHG